MKRLSLLFAVVLQISLATAQNNYKRVHLTNLTKSTVSKLAQAGIDFRCGAITKGNITAIDLSDFEITILNDLKIPYTIEIDDLTRFYSERATKELPIAKLQLKQEKLRNSRKAARLVTTTNLENYLEYVGNTEIDWQSPTNFNLGASFGGCLTVSEVLSELDDMHSQYPSLISAKLDASTNPPAPYNTPAESPTTTYGNSEGGTTWPGQTIHYVRITGDQSSPEGTKPQILFTSMIHSREVSSLMSNMFFMWYLLENYNTNAAIKHLVDNNELYFIPIVNPDGLRWNEVIAPNGGGMQRKNLRPGVGSGNKRGVDVNRNFDYFWGSAGDPSGSSNTGGSDTYRGPSAFSEPEAKILRNFVLGRNFKTVLMNHAYANAIPHPYGGNPTFTSGREDEMHKMHEEMTRYNRYVSGATIFSAANGIADDWMVGGAADTNGSTGSGQNILATTPEHGHQGFWPSATNIVAEAKRGMRIYLTAAYYGGKYAKFHDLTSNNITSLTSDLKFGIERIGQTATDFTLTITPISSNITSINAPSTITGMTILEQREISTQIQLDPSIVANDEIKYNIKLSNNDAIFYDVDISKYYQPNVLFEDDPDTNMLNNWDKTGNWVATTSSAYSGSTSIKNNNAVPYANNETGTLTTKNAVDLTGADKTIVQFYTKWDIERNFDFVELLGSTDGTNWIPLNGKYNKPTAKSDTNDAHSGKSSTQHSHQDNSSSDVVYDGDRFDNWVMEEIIIDGSNNSALNNSNNVKFRFRFKSDSNNKPESYTTTYDGFFFDDFKVIKLQLPCVLAVPTGVTASTITASEATISWNPVQSATYDLRYRQTGTTTWTDVLDITSTSHTLAGLTTTTEYDVEVRSKCDASTSSYSNTITFTTTAPNYCTAQGNNSNFEYISSVDIGGSNNTSSNSPGKYEDYTSLNVFPDLEMNSEVTLTVDYTWSGTAYNEAVSAWIDYNKNGVFEANEKVLESASSQTKPVSASFTIPNNALAGNTRMRVLLKYYSGTGQIANDPCETFDYGEVEDYTVSISDTGSLSNLNLDMNNLFKVAPNPFKDNISVRLINNTSFSSLINVELLDITGRSVLKRNWNVKNNNQIIIDNLNNLGSGIYLLKIKDTKTSSSILKRIVK